MKTIDTNVLAGYNTGIGSSHLHTAKALRKELSEGGFDTLSVHGVMGGAWLAPNLNKLLAKEDSRNLLMKIIRAINKAYFLVKHILYFDILCILLS